MRCCAPGCKNDSRHVSKSQGITFHIFPTEPNLRTSWLRAIGKHTWAPKDRSAICSEHFLAEDFYETKSGLRKIRTGAVPVALQENLDCDLGQPAPVMACRICLAMDTKLVSIKKHQLDEAYEHLTGLSVKEEDNLPQQLCPECAQRLLTCNRFRRKSLRAHSLMVDLVKQYYNLTPQTLSSIDRHSNQLTSWLQVKYMEPDHCDLYIEYTEPTFVSGHPDFDAFNVEVEVKNESEVFINEIESDFHEDLTDPTLHESETIDKQKLLTNASSIEQNETDLGFTSDDSLPLEVSRKKVKNKKKTRNKLEKKEMKRVKKRTIKKDSNEPKIDRRRKPFLNEDLSETLFTITDLTVEEQLAEIEKRRESSNFKNAVYKCNECFKGFLDEDAYNGHMTRHTIQCGEYQCDICKTHFKQPHALRKHITAHHTQRFSCNQCPYVTTHRQTARLHERWHKGTKYQCPHCQDEFVKFTTYMGHIRIKHPSDFVCQLCGFSFVSEKGIELHKKLKHRLDTDEIAEDGPLCDMCNIRFVSAEALKQHMRVSARHNTSDKDSREANKPKKGRKTKEAKERDKKARENCKDVSDGEDRRIYPSQMRKAEGPIPCEQCGLQLEDSRAYHSHFRRMHPDKNRTNYPSMKSPCMCEVCGRMFQSYALLKDHRWVHTGEKPFKCDTCGKSFRMKQRLVAHRRVHRLPLGTHGSKCETCEKSLRMKQRLVAHRRVHSAMKSSYLCNLCGKHFSTHSNRQRHMFIHTGLKPFKCEMCSKCFKHASEKRAHITYVHLKKPWPKRSRAKRRSENRQSSQPPQLPTSASEMDLVQPIWPTCDPKLDHMNAIIEDKPMYYNVRFPKCYQDTS